MNVGRGDNIKTKERTWKNEGKRRINKKETGKMEFGVFRTLFFPPKICCNYSVLYNTALLYRIFSITQRIQLYFVKNFTVRISFFFIQENTDTVNTRKYSNTAKIQCYIQYSAGLLKIDGIMSKCKNHYKIKSKYRQNWISSLIIPHTLKRLKNNSPLK